MKITTGEAQTARIAVQQMIGVKLPFGAAMTIRKLNRELTAIHEDAEAERMKLIDTHAQKGDDGQPVVEGNRFVFQNGSEAAFAKAYNELLAAEVEVSAQLTAKGMENVEIEPGLLIAMGPLLAE